jgi:hypothetical protein
MRAIICHYFHDTTLGVQLGVTKTLHKIARQFYWPELNQYVRRYVAKCDKCLRAKPARNTKVGFHSAETDSRPFQRLCVDFVGPLTRTRSGNRVDGFSKFVWLFPLRDMTVRAVVNTLVRYIFGQ